MSKMELSRECIEEILESKKPVSLTEVYRHLGGVGKLSGSTAGKIRNLFPDIEKVVAGNRAGAAQADGKPEATLRTSGKSKTPGKKASKVTYPHCDKNPFREGSNYSLAFDILAASKDGLPWRNGGSDTPRRLGKASSWPRTTFRCCSRQRTRRRVSAIGPAGKVSMSSVNATM